MPKSRIELELEADLKELRADIEREFVELKDSKRSLPKRDRDRLTRMLDRYDDLENERKQARSDRVRRQEKVY